MSIQKLIKFVEEGIGNQPHSKVSAKISILSETGESAILRVVNVCLWMREQASEDCLELFFWLWIALAESLRSLPRVCLLGAVEVKVITSRFVLFS
jgi:hypothetical protein